MNYHLAFRIVLLAAALLALCHVCSAGTLGEIKRDTPDGVVVSFQGAVAAVFVGSVYVEQTDRSQGIRVDTVQVLSEGDLVGVSGTIHTDLANDERYIAAADGYPARLGGTQSIRPIGVPARAVVGGDFGLQKGISGDGGLNNVGLLVTVWGSVTGFDTPSNPSLWFEIDGSPGQSIRVRVPSGVKIDTDWAHVAVTGICSVEKVGSSMIRVIKVRRSEDIVAHQSWAENRIKGMTLDEKVGQLFQVRVDGDVFTDAIRQTIQDKHIGGIVYFQYNGNLDDPTASAQFSNDLQACAVGPDGSGIPLFLSMDQEGGRVTRITGGSDFPGNMALGAGRSAGLAQLAGGVIGTEIRAVGANMDLAPVLDVNNNPVNPVIGVRSFGEQPGLVSTLGQAYVSGLHSAGVIATGKHFPGHGDTSVDSHTGLPIVTYDFGTLDAVHGQPFREAIASGLDAIMTAHIVVTCLDPDRPATLSPEVIDGYLRSTLGFDGVVMTDSMGMAGITAGYSVAQASVMAIQAGADLLSLSPDLATAIEAVKSAVASGGIPQARLDQSVMRILRLKHRYGLFDDPYVDASAAAGIVGSQAHRSAELETARAAITLVQNTGAILPLNLTAGQKILLVTVQSSETTTDAATRFASYITAKHSNTQSMSISENPGSSARTSVKTAAAAADVVIVGTSRSQLSANAGQATLVKQLRVMGKPVVVVGLREPYELAGFPEVNAYLAAYNYRNCGFQAAAEAIFGEFSPSGSLPVTIPGLYSFGHGFGY